MHAYIELRAVGASLDMVFYGAFSYGAAGGQKYWMFVVVRLAAVAVHPVNPYPESIIFFPSLATTLPVLVSFYVFFESWAATTVESAFGKYVLHFVLSFRLILCLRFNIL